MIRIVNMIPNSMSGEANQDSEPNLAVNPENVNDMVGTAFTPWPMGGSNSPIYISTDAGNTWSLRDVLIGATSFGTTADVTVAFATTGGMLYAGLLNGSTLALEIVRTAAITGTTPLMPLVTRGGEDQPWVVAGSAVVAGVSKDRVFVGNNDFAQPGNRTATVDISQDAATAPAPAGFAPLQLDQRATSTFDSPQTRIAVHSDGTVYAAFEPFTTPLPPPGTYDFDFNFDVVVARDDHWGAGVPPGTAPFSGLVDSVDGVVGQRVATGLFAHWNAEMGQERLGADLTIAVDPTNSSTVWIAWCDRVGGSAGTDWTLHVVRSVDRGQSWTADLRTITNVKNPALAINSAGSLALLYQAFTGTTWDTKLEITSNGWSTPVTPLVLHTASSSTPSRSFFPYLGDYVRLLAVETSFFGVFCGNNTPNMANFPQGVTYQRNVNWTTQTLLNTDGVTAVPVSIDPFFFEWSPSIVHPIVGPRRPPSVVPPSIVRQPVIHPGPIAPRPPNPPQPPEPPAPGPIAPAPVPGGTTDIDL